MCSFFEHFHQSVRWLIHLRPLPEPLDLSEEGSWQHCMQSLRAGSLPAFFPGKICSWSSLHLAPSVPRRVIILRSGYFATDHRPVSDLDTTVIQEPQRRYWTFLLDSHVPANHITVNPSHWAHSKPLHRWGPAKPEGLQPPFVHRQVRLPRETPVTPIHRGHQVSICSSFFLLAFPFFNVMETYQLVNK